MNDNCLEESTLSNEERKYRDIDELRDLIEEYKGKGVGFVRIEASYDSQNLWEAQVKHNDICLSNLAKNSKFSNLVTMSLDRIGAQELIITDVTSKQSSKTTDEGWQNWFMRRAANEPNSSKQRDLIPDTNFLMRRYGTGLLRRLGEERFRELHFAIPNLVILEVEAIYNRAKKTSEGLLELSKSAELKPKQEQEQNKATFEMKEALIATKELMFLRDRGAYILSADIEGALGVLSEIAGKRFTDRYIRKEIRDAVKYYANPDLRFLTCDLMNALSAVAECLPTLYFSRIRTKSDKYYLSLGYDSCLEQLAALIVDTTTVFEEINVNWHFSGKKESVVLKGLWDDWTIEDLLNNRILEESSALEKA